MRATISVFLAFLASVAPATVAPVLAFENEHVIERVVCIPRAGTSRPIQDVVPGDKGLTTVRWKFPVWEVHEGRSLDKMYTYACPVGAQVTGDPGEPVAPMVRYNFEVAPNETVILEGVTCEWDQRGLSGRWMPAQKDDYEGFAMPVEVPPGSAYETKGDMFEAQRAELSEPYSFGGHWFRSLAVRPVACWPKQGKFQIARQVEVRLRRPHPLDSKNDVEHVQRVHAGYLIISPKQFEKALEPFLAFKRKAHPDLEVKWLEDVGNTVEAVDAVIEQAARRGTPYVLLVGHSTLLPAAPADYDGDGKPECFDSDNVYRNLGTDGLPGVQVGRWPVVNALELANVIEKTLHKFQHPELYQDHIVMAAHEQDAPGKYQGCVKAIAETLAEESNIELAPTMILPAPVEKEGLGSRYPDLVKALGRGCSLFLYRGHGRTDQLATTLLDRFGSKVSQWYETKTPIQPVFYSIACLNGQMTDKDHHRAMGLCENLVTSPSPGAVAAIGAVQPSPTIPNHTFARNLMWYTYVDPQPTLGAIFNKALATTEMSGFTRYRWAREWEKLGWLYNLYGDPELPVIVPRHRAN